MQRSSQRWSLLAAMPRLRCAVNCVSTGPVPGETSCLSLVWAVLDLFFSHASNGATFTDVDRQHLYRIKYQQADPDTIDEEVTAA
jgi:hypothetical protein